MAFFGDKVDQETFEAFKSAIESKLEVIDSDIKNLAHDVAEKTPVEVQEIRVAAEQVAADKTAIRGAAEQAASILEAVGTQKGEMDNSLSTLKGEVAETQKLFETLKTNITGSQTLQTELAASKAKTDGNVSEIANNLEKTKIILKQAEVVPAQIDAAAKLLKDCEGLRDNIQGLVDHSLNGKSQIDGVINEIFGQDVKGSDGKVEKVEGLRGKIEKSFDGASNDLNKLMERAHTDVNQVTKELKALMPGAMAAGLSAAFEAKAEIEITSLKKLERNFIYGIAGLLIVSLLPVWLGFNLVESGKALLDVLKLPLFPLVLPLYFPLLWFAYSTSKKANLAKRLIEEYTHKSVLGKTFSGLSNQIESLPKDSEVRHDLWTRLLYSVLQVSAENPGKLITDYKKADHPLMEALESSAKAAESINILERIPGLSGLARVMTERLNARAAEQTAKVKEGLAAAVETTEKTIAK